MIFWAKAFLILINISYLIGCNKNSTENSNEGSIVSEENHIRPEIIQTKSLMTEEGFKPSLRLAFTNNDISAQELESLSFGENVSGPGTDGFLLKADRSRKNKVGDTEIVSTNISVKTITAIRDDGESVLIGSYPVSEFQLDLISINNGESLDIGGLVIPNGFYEQIVLELYENNRIVVREEGVNKTHPLNLINRKASFKINKKFLISDTQLATFIISFDLNRSIKYNKSHGWQLKPVLKLKHASEKSKFQRSCPSFAVLAGPSPDSLASFDNMRQALDVSKAGWLFVLGNMIENEKIEIIERSNLKIYNQCNPKISSIHVLKSKNIEFNGLKISMIDGGGPGVHVHGANIENEEIFFNGIEIEGNTDDPCLKLGNKNKTIHVSNANLINCGTGIIGEKNLTFTGTNVSISGSRYKGIELSRDSTFVLSNSTIINSGEEGISQNGAGEMRLDGVSIKNNGKNKNSYGIRFNQNTIPSQISLNFVSILNNTGLRVEDQSSIDFNRFGLIEEDDKFNFSTTGEEPYFSSGSKQGIFKLDDQEAEFQILPNSLPANLKVTDLTITHVQPDSSLSQDMIETHSVFGNGFRFGPSGTQFDKPILATLPFPIEESPILADGERYSLAYFNKEENRLEVIPTAIVDGQSIVGLTHFSEYFYVVVFSPVPQPLKASDETIRGYSSPDSWDYELNGYPYYEQKFELWEDRENSCEALDTGENGLDFIVQSSHLKANDLGILDFFEPGIDVFDVLGEYIVEQIKGTLKTEFDKLVSPVISSAIGSIVEIFLDEVLEIFLGIPFTIDVTEDCAKFSECMSFGNKNFSRCLASANTANHGLAINFATSCIEQVFLGTGVVKIIDQNTKNISWPAREPTRVALKALLSALKIWVTTTVFSVEGPMVYAKQALSCGIEGALVIGIVSADVQGRMAGWVSNQDNFNSSVKKVLATPYCPLENIEIPGSYYYELNKETTLGFKELSFSIGVKGRYDDVDYDYPKSDYINITKVETMNEEDIKDKASFNLADQTVDVTFTPSVINDYITVTLENESSKESNTCVAQVSDTKMELQTHEFVVQCESAATSGNTRKSCHETMCFKLITQNGSDGAIIDSSFEPILLRGSETTKCHDGVRGLQIGYNNTQFHEVCFYVQARGEEGDDYGKGDSGIARCNYKVNYIKTPGTEFEIYRK